MNLVTEERDRWPDPNLDFLGGDAQPFTAFNFAVEIHVPGVSKQVCNAAFAECDGLEMTMEVKTIREGGNNAPADPPDGPASASASSR